MDPRAMEPHGQALLAFLEGDTETELVVRRDDGYESSLPARVFFREPADFTELEERALARCKGHVLDVGAGSGLHSLYLQGKGLPVTAIDISRLAVEVMARRGVQSAICADVFAYEGGPYDTVLMLGHGIGLVEDLDGLDRFLQHVASLVRQDGAVLLDSYDVRASRDRVHLAYHEMNRTAGRYYGETVVQLEYRGITSPFCGWLHVDPTTLAEHATKYRWTSTVLARNDDGNYLAMLQKTPGRGVS